jgi:hypothetical protein
MLAYYGKARVTLDGWRFIKSKLSRALSQWRAEVPPENLSPPPRACIEKWLKWSEKSPLGESEAGTKAVETINKKHLQVEKGRVDNDVEVGGHKVVEVPDGHGGIICEYHSSEGPEVICPIVLATHEEAPAQPAKRDSKTADPEEKPTQREVVTQPAKQAPVVAPPI